jgi:hypothetical protein
MFIVVWMWLNITLDFLLLRYKMTLYDECDVLGFNAVYFGRIPPTFLRNVGGHLHGVTTQKSFVFITHFFILSLVLLTKHN